MVILSSLVAVLGSDKSASTQNFANFSMSSNRWGEVLVLVVVLQWRYLKFWWVDPVLVIFKKVTVEIETVFGKRLGQALPECDNRQQ